MIGHLPFFEVSIVSHFFQKVRTNPETANGPVFEQEFNGPVREKSREVII